MRDKATLPSSTETARRPFVLQAATNASASTESDSAMSTSFTGDMLFKVRPHYCIKNYPEKFMGKWETEKQSNLTFI
jgi:hypothetical protein